MSSFTIAMLSIACVSGIMHIYVEYRGPKHWAYLFKPLTTSSILLIALFAGDHVPETYRYWIAAGLIFSLGGDVFLMLPSDKFLYGLASFLIGHLCYIAAFTWAAPFSLDPLWLIALALPTLVLLRILVPHMGKLRIPAFCYVAAILTMVWQARGLWAFHQTTAALLALVGALLFLVSDSALAVRQFRGKYHWAQLIILSTYYPAQALIALSVPFSSMR